MGEMICLGQRRLHSLSAWSSAWSSLYMICCCFLFPVWCIQWFIVSSVLYVAGYVVMVYCFFCSVCCNGLLFHLFCMV